MGDITGMQMAGAGVGAVDAFVQYRNNKQLEDLAEAQRNVSNQAAVVELAANLSHIESEADQLMEQNMQHSIDAQRAAAMMKGSVEANAAATGITGGAVDMQMRDIDIEAARAMSTNAINHEYKVRALQNKQTSADTQFKNRLQLMPVQTTSPWAAALAGVGGGLTSALQFGEFETAYNEAQDAKPNTSN